MHVSRIIVTGEIITFRNITFCVLDFDAPIIDGEKIINVAKTANKRNVKT